MRVVYSLILLNISCINIVFAMQDTLTTKNGTYMGSYYYKHNKRLDTSYLRIHFFNDTTFAFVFGGGNNTPNSQEKLNFNSSFEKGIARLVKNNGKTVWIGLTDDKDGNGFINQIDTAYLTTNHIFSIYQALNGANYAIDENYKYNTYTILQFDFSKGAIDVSIASSHSQKFFQAIKHHQLDNFPMEFAIEQNYSNYDLSINYLATIKSPGALTLLPIPEKIPQNKLTGRLTISDSVYLLQSYMKYLLVAEYDPQGKKVVQYGWILRDKVQNIQKVNRNLGTPRSEKIYKVIVPKRVKP